MSKSEFRIQLIRVMSADIARSGYVNHAFLNEERESMIEFGDTLEYGLDRPNISWEGPED